MEESNRHSEERWGGMRKFLNKIKHLDNDTQYALITIVMVILFFLFAIWVKSW